MTKFYTLLLTSLTTAAAAQVNPSTIDYLDTNNVRTAILCNADFGWDMSSSQYEVPKGSGKHPLYCGSLWIGGYHNGGLRMAAHTYRQMGTEFWPGPLDTTNASITVTSSNQWNKLWKVTSNDIAQFIQQWGLGNVQNGSYTPSQSILTWPAHGSGNEAKYLAPFVDLNGNGAYDPVQDGDYPLIKGDQMIWWVINDKLAAHNETGAAPIGVEVHCSAYSYNRPCVGEELQALNSTTFYHYKIINRNTDQLDSAAVGFFLDPDLGNFADDYVGSNIRQNRAFAYNGGASDAVYGAKPPAFSLLFLKGPYSDLGDATDNDRDSCIDCSWTFSASSCSKDNSTPPIPDNVQPEEITMTSFMYHDNTTPAMTNYHHALISHWGTGVHLTYGGNGTNTSAPACSFAFPGTSDPYGWGMGYQPGMPPIPAPGSVPWTEHDLVRTPGERKMYVGSGRFTLKPQGVHEVEMALIFSRDTVGCSNNLCALTVAEADADTIQKLYRCNPGFPICGQVNNIAEITQPFIDLHPNPAYTQLNVIFSRSAENATFEILNALGQSIIEPIRIKNKKEISIPVVHLAAGVYFVKIMDGDQAVIKKFIKE